MRSLALIDDLRPDMVKADRQIIAGLPHDGPSRIDALRGTRKDPLPKTPVVSRKAGGDICVADQ